MNKSNLILASAIAIIFTSILIIFSPNSQKLNFSSSAPSPTLSQSISPIPDPTADWKIYENKEYGFSFKYPSNYSFDENNPLPNKKGYLQVSIMSPLDHQNDKRTTLNSKELKMEIYIEPQQVNDSLDKFFNEGARTDGNPLGPYSNTTISGVSAVKLNWEGMGDGTSYYLLSGDNRIVITKYPQLTELDTVFSQILSTFKFFSSTTPTKSAIVSASPTKSATTSANLLPSDLIALVKSKAAVEAKTTADKVIIGQSRIIGDYAQIAYGYSDGGGAIYWAAKVDGVWKIVTGGQEPPACSVLLPYKFPSDFECIK